MTTRMHGVESSKIIDVKQAKLINNYKKTKHNLLKSNASDKYMYFTH